jgi:hypothetical protein
MHIASASADQPNIAFRNRVSSPDAEWFFSKALSTCDDVLRSRQQSIMIDDVAFDAAGEIDGERLARLLARALRDMSVLSRRGAVLSLTADGSAIVIESHHPIEIPGAGLEIDSAIKEEARTLHVAAEMTWDQGRGPRLTLMLPAGGGRR